MKVHMGGSFLHLDRIENGDLSYQTLGYLHWYEDFVLRASWATVEPPWRSNLRNKSCIPNGWYQAKRRSSQRYGEHLQIVGVPERDFILIHPGNYRTQSQGCVLPGKSFVDINGDGNLDVGQSRVAMNEILELVMAPTLILVTSEFLLA